jgi:DNA-binding IclR family transcriptional regulator
MAPNQSSSEPTSRTLKTLTLAFEILNFIHKHDGARARDLEESFELSRSAIYNHLTTLEQSEWLIKHGDEYRLSQRFITIGRHMKNKNALYRIAQSEIIDLATETSELVHLETEEHGRRVTLATEVGSDAVGEEYHQRIEAGHLHYAAGGKAILAYLGEDRVREISDHFGLPAPTTETVTNIDKLFEELAEIRKRGYALADEEYLQGLRAVGAPIIDDSGTVLGSVAVSGPISRLKGKFFQEQLPEKVMNAARVIELNYNMESRIDNKHN